MDFLCEVVNYRYDISLRDFIVVFKMLGIIECLKILLLNYNFN